MLQQNIHFIFSEYDNQLRKQRAKEQLRDHLQQRMEEVYEEISKEGVEQQGAFRQQLLEVTKKLDAIEEKYYVTGEMTKETFEKFHFRFKAEQAAVAKELERCGSSISNPSVAIAKALDLSLELAPAWASSDVSRKEKLQKLVFPEGIIYDKKIGAFRTTRVNAVFELIASLERISEEKKKGQTSSEAVHPFGRRERDSNPRNLTVQRFSRPPHSTTLPSLRGENKVRTV